MRNALKGGQEGFRARRVARMVGLYGVGDLGARWGLYEGFGGDRLFSSERFERVDGSR